MLVVFALLFNVQASLSHEVEHFFHESSNDAQHECDDCLLKNHLAASNDQPKMQALFPSISNAYSLEGYLGNQRLFRFATFQSQAP